jgi:hypothetical protein
MRRRFDNVAPKANLTEDCNQNVIWRRVQSLQTQFFFSTCSCATL